MPAFRDIPVKQALVLAAFVGASLGLGNVVLTSRDDAPAPGGLVTPSPSASASPSARPSLTPTKKATATRSAKPTKMPPGKPRYRSGPVNVPVIACGSQTATRTVRFRVRTQVGLETTPHRFAEAVRDILCDQRSWRASGAVRFRYDPQGQLLIGLRSPDESQRRCLELTNLSVNRKYSCATHREIVINSDRWFTGSPRYANGTLHYPRPLEEYRQMLINHEVGHALGLRHQNCARDGAPAPVMMQQSKGMRSPNGKTCKPNPWPLREELDRL